MSEAFKGLVRLKADQVIELSFTRLVQHECDFKEVYQRKLNEVTKSLRSFNLFGWKPLKNITEARVKTRGEFEHAVRYLRWDDREVRERIHIALDLANAANSDGGDGWVYLPHEVALEICGRSFKLDGETSFS